MEQDLIFWYPKNKTEDCFDLFERYISPHLAPHQTLRIIKEMPDKCEYILKKFPLVKKKDLKE